MNPLKILYIGLGFFFFGLGAVGAFLPVLPTVPFLLLASFFFAKGSERFNKWFTSTKLYKDNLEGFIKNRSMTLKTKLYCQGIAALMMTLSLIFVPLLVVKIFLIVMMLFMFYYFARHIKTVTPEEMAVINAENKARQDAHAKEKQVTLRETIGEVKEMHEEILNPETCPDKAE
ncbi:MAG: YbaN family protein [Coriobacteriia bacterium]|nr:YbaN family protein [Coriobacteriia bacterium]MCL2750468.1 YbaN family protein [Coriobacteriia bacterium]